MTLHSQDVTELAERTTEPSSDDWEVEVFYDGDCPLCRREIDFIRRRDHKRRLRLTDIASTEFSAASLGVSHDELMARIHGRLPDGSIIQGVEVFRRLYGAIGWQWPVAISRWPLVSTLFDWGYYLFARNRLKLTGRCTTSSCRVR